MKHLGDITKISGLTAPIVDCIIGGSPCQDLSVANGRREGLEGKRSGLFMEQIRIVKEMREQDVRSGRSGVDVRPRFMVWENVCGSLSSPGKDKVGEDFRVVLEEVAGVIEEGVTIPRPPKGKWSTTGVIVLDGGSIAWRVSDAQYWGVPQRRRRIALVADFNGYTAPRILFGEVEHNRSTERGDTESSLGDIGGEPRSEVQPLCEGLSGNTEQSKQKRKETSPDASRGIGADDREGITFEPGIASREGGHIYEGVSGTLRAKAGDNQMAVAYTMQDREGKAGGGKGALIAKEVSATLRANNMQYLFQPIAIDMGGGKSSVDIHTDRSPTLTTTHYGEPAVVYSSEVVALDRASFNQGKNAKYDFEISEDGINSTIVAKGPSAVCYGIGSYDSNAWKSNNPHSGVYEADTARTLDAINCGYPACNQGGTAVVQGFPEVREGVVGTLDAHYSNFPGCRGGMERTMVVDSRVSTRYIVRRLTPLECERLQGFPDGWTDIGEYIDSKGKKKQSSDAARYKALGNSIALPPWKWVLKRLCACYERDATMASLFDGIGGFPSLWEQINGNGTCLWASEIEDFPIAVTKKRIGGDIDG